jgi:hypothetical protein
MKQNTHQVILPIDCVTDCMDVYELICGAKGLSNDTQQRLIILSLREYRGLGILRAVFHAPTTVMLADGLTKVGRFAQLMKYCTSSFMDFAGLQGRFFRFNVTATRTTLEFDEEH